MNRKLLCLMSHALAAHTKLNIRGNLSSKHLSQVGKGHLRPRSTIPRSLAMVRPSAAACLATFTILILFAPASAKRHERLIDSWKPVDYKVSLTLNDRLTEITAARAEINILSLKDRLIEIDLDFGELIVDSVTVDGQSETFQRNPDRLNVKLSRYTPRNVRLTLVISYHGTPKDGLIMTTDKSGKPSAIGDNWPNRLHHWIPCLDHPSAKAPIRFTVTAPARATVVANGKLDGVDTTADGSRTWTYTETDPIPPYCMVIAVGEFAQVSPKLQTITPLSYYVPTSDKDFALQGFAPANPSLKFFSQTVAPYPYDKLALIVGATRFGGMENSGAIVFSSNLFDSRPAPRLSKTFNIREGIVSLVAHEIAHQWFGDSVTESTWSDLWLSEGFATYFAGMFIQRHEGEEEFKRYMATQAKTYLGYAKKTRTPLYDTETENLLSLLNENNYQKGAWVLHMLRMHLGDDAFFRGIRDYYRRHEGGTATSEDLRAALEKSSERNLKNFFASWVYGGGHPHYELSSKWMKRGRSGALLLTLRQLQSEPAFLIPVPVEIVTSAGTKRVVVTPVGKETTVRVSTNGRPTSLRLDPDETILKEVTIK